MICLALTAERCDKLHLHAQVERNTAQLGTAFTVTVDAHPKFGVSTGISVQTRRRRSRWRSPKTPSRRICCGPGTSIRFAPATAACSCAPGRPKGASISPCLAGLKPAAVICEIMRDDGEMARRPELEAFCDKHQSEDVHDRGPDQLPPEARAVRQADRERHAADELGRVSAASRTRARSTPSRTWRCARAASASWTPDGKPIIHEEPVLVRVHSECLTGDVFGSGRCDCGPQLSTAMQMIEKTGKGVLIYLRQEGRGIGLANKLHAYALQEKGLDTVEANVRLGLPVDKRDYGIGSQILRDLGLRKLRIMTNNPKKIYGIDGYGLCVVDRVPIRIEPGEFNKAYLATKKEKMGHIL